MKGVGRGKGRGAHEVVCRNRNKGEEEKDLVRNKSMDTPNDGVK